MDDSPVLVIFKLILVLALVLLNGFFVAAEFALVKVRTTRIAQLSDEGNAAARFAQRLIKNLDIYLSATQLGITLSSLALGWLGEPVISTLLSPLLKFTGPAFGHQTSNVIAIVVAFFIITTLHIILGEMLPKSVAIRKAEATTLWISRPLRFFYLLFQPIIWLLNKFSYSLLKLFKLELVTDQQQAHTEEEIRMLMEHSHQSGIIDTTELSLLGNIFDFTDRIGSEIMVPRINMVCIYTHLSFEENLSIIQKSHFTRFPLCGRDKDDVVGIIHIRDLYESMTKHTLGKEKDVKWPDLSKLARAAVMLPETMEIKDILRTLQKNRTEIAITIDEYGGTSGIITTEDIIEEIVGEITDEFDDDQKPLFQENNNNETSIDAQLLIKEVNEHFNLNIEDEENHTIGGWVFSKLQQIPQIGAKVFHPPYSFTVQEMTERKISRLLVGICNTSSKTTQIKNE